MFFSLAKSCVLFSLCFLALILQHQRTIRKRNADPSAIKRTCHQTSLKRTVAAVGTADTAGTVGSVNPVIVGKGTADCDPDLDADSEGFGFGICTSSDIQTPSPGIGPFGS